MVAAAESGSKFSNWTGDVSGSNPVTQITMTGNKAVTAHFVTDTNDGNNDENNNNNNSSGNNNPPLILGGGGAVFVTAGDAGLANSANSLQSLSTGTGSAISGSSQTFPNMWYHGANYATRFDKLVGGPAFIYLDFGSIRGMLGGVSSAASKIGERIALLSSQAKRIDEVLQSSKLDQKRISARSTAGKKQKNLPDERKKTKDNPWNKIKQQLASLFKQVKLFAGISQKTSEKA